MGECKMSFTIKAATHGSMEVMFSIEETSKETILEFFSRFRNGDITIFNYDGDSITLELEHFELDGTMTEYEEDEY
jgi:hypothetical protein